MSDKIITYKIHDNMYRPYKVLINTNDKILTIYKVNEDLTEKLDKFVYEKNPLFVYNPIRIFVGRSSSNEMTDDKARFNKFFDGNTLLLHMKDLNYIFIGGTIFSFKAKNEIIEYHSPVGRNDVPYPFAIDSKNNYYLMTENIIIKGTNKTLNEMSKNTFWENDKLNIDPYDYFYSKYDVPMNENRNTGFYSELNANIEKIYENGESIKLSCNTDLDKFYKNGNFSIKMKDCEKKQNITTDQLKNLLNNITKELGFEKMKTNLIYER